MIRIIPNRRILLSFRLSCARVFIALPATAMTEAVNLSLATIYLSSAWMVAFPHVKVFIVNRITIGTLHQVSFTDHHRGVVSVPFGLGVFVWVATTKNLLLMLRVLKLRFREHILEVSIALVDRGLLRRL